MDKYSEQGCEFLIIGAGITGLTIARELVGRGYGDITVIEKERGLGAHASGRNSGVLHAGVYYSPGTYKARFCVEGNRLMKEFCRDKGLTLKETGKVIVTDNNPEGLLDLKRRADSSGAVSHIIDRRELMELEPHALPAERALYSPETAVIDPVEILEALKKELESSGKVRIFFGTFFKGAKEGLTVITNKGNIKFHKLVNAAGTFADKVARAYGIGRRYKVLPIKGTYKKLSPKKSYLVNGNIYPVPDLRNPFLGLHFTRSVYGDVYIGPSAIPALGREEYGLFNDLSSETASIVMRDLILLFTSEAFRASASIELKKFSRSYFTREARRLVPELNPEDLQDTPKTGIRPQLVDWNTKKLVMDFLLIRDGETLHILNTISPAFTCSMAFAKHAVDQLLD